MANQLSTVPHMDITNYVNLVRELDEIAEIDEADGLTHECHAGNVLLVLGKMITEGPSAASVLDDIRQFLRFVA